VILSSKQSISSQWVFRESGSKTSSKVQSVWELYLVTANGYMWRKSRMCAREMAMSSDRRPQCMMWLLYPTTLALGKMTMQATYKDRLPTTLSANSISNRLSTTSKPTTSISSQCKSSQVAMSNKSLLKSSGNPDSRTITKTATSCSSDSSNQSAETIVTQLRAQTVDWQQHQTGAEDRAKWAVINAARSNQSKLVTLAPHPVKVQRNGVDGVRAKDLWKLRK